MADASDIISLAEGYLAVNDRVNFDAVDGGGSGNHDDEMARYITAISRRIDDLCGPVVVRTITGETHDGGGHEVWLDEWPVDSVTSVVEYDNTDATTLTAETNSTKPADAYLLDRFGKHDRILRRRSSNGDSRFAPGRRNVVVTYDAGRYASTATVDARFKFAAQSVLRRLRQREGSAWSTGGNPFDVEVGSPGFFNAVDHVVAELLGDDKRAPGVG